MNDQGQTPPIHPELRALLSRLPTEEYLDASLAKVEAGLRRDILSVQTQVSEVTNRVSTLEPVVESHSLAISQWESRFLAMEDRLTSLHLQVDDLENRHRRNNLRIRGVPEAINGEDLKSLALGICNKFLERDPTASIEMDRVHRALGPKSNDPAKPRDIICRIHFFAIKDEISRKAWRKGHIDWNGARIQILQDLSRQTLGMRRSLKPLLQLILETGATYRWGFPFHLVVRKGPSVHYVNSQADLPRLFDLLGTAPIQVADWLGPILNPDLMLPQRPPRQVEKSSRRKRNRTGRSGPEVHAP